MDLPLDNALRLSKRLSGQASSGATHSYFARMKDLYPSYKAIGWYTEAGKTGLGVSRLGYGGYRITIDQPSHIQSLRRALGTGTNVVDTAANFTNGKSERLVGEVLGDMVHHGSLYREEIVIISKAGYLEGDSRRWSYETSSRYHNTIPISNNVDHSIDAAFLRDQLEGSLNRMGLEVIDFYLLHNPEHHFFSCIQSGMSENAAQEHYLNLLSEAFMTLEELRRSGKIQYYGISSNALANDEYSALTLKGISAIAPAGFMAVEFPANLLEQSYRVSMVKAGDQNTLCHSAHSMGIWSIGNRPLNAMGSNDQLIRLAGLPATSHNALNSLKSIQTDLEKIELKLIQSVGVERFRFDDRTPAFSDILIQYRDSFETPEHLNEVLPSIRSAMHQTFNRIRVVDADETNISLLYSYGRIVEKAIGEWEYYIRWKREDRAERIRNLIGKLWPELSDHPLAIQAVRSLLSEDCPQTVLVGQRKVEYVDALTAIYRMNIENRTDLDQYFRQAATMLKQELEKSP